MTFGMSASRAPWGGGALQGERSRKKNFLHTERGRKILSRRFTRAHEGPLRPGCHARAVKASAKSLAPPLCAHAALPPAQHKGRCHAGRGCAPPAFNESCMHAGRFNGSLLRTNVAPGRSHWLELRAWRMHSSMRSMRYAFFASDSKSTDRLLAPKLKKGDAHRGEHSGAPLVVVVARAFVSGTRSRVVATRRLARGARCAPGSCSPRARIVALAAASMTTAAPPPPSSSSATPSSFVSHGVAYTSPPSTPKGRLTMDGHTPDASPRPWPPISADAAFTPANTPQAPNFYYAHTQSKDLLSKIANLSVAPPPSQQQASAQLS